MDPSKFAGMCWDAWAHHVEDQSKEELVNVDSSVNKLQKEDMKIFGRIVDSEPLNLIVCEECGMLVKAQALFHHYTKKHIAALAGGSSCGKYSPKMAEMKDSPVVESSTVSSYSGNLFVKDDDCCSTTTDVNENIKDGNKFVLPPLIASRRVKRLQTSRSPLGQMCTNKWHSKKKESRMKRLKERTFPLLKRKDASLQDEKMETNSETNDGVEYLLHQLPGMTLNSAKEEQACGGVAAPSGSVAFISNPPRALSVTPFFSCHRAGGLLYPGRHMKTTRQILQQMFNDDGKIPANLLQQIKARRKNPISRKKK